jgi:hypothetical protein
VYGAFRADVGVGNGNGAAGSGGTLRLRVGTLAGSATGYITANGGANGGARAGGGRLALEYASRAGYLGRVQASGSFGTTAGAGTIYELNTSTGFDKVTVEQLSNTTGTVVATAYPTMIPANEGPFDEIALRGGTLTLPANAVDAGTALTVAAGTLNVSSPITAQRLTMTGGSAVVAATLTAPVAISGGTLTLNVPHSYANAADFQVTSTGTVTNNSTLTLPSFETTVLGGTLINQGDLQLTSNQLTVPTTATLSQGGSINGGVALSALTVLGRITHELRDTDGVRLDVNGDALIGAGGSIDASVKGLRGGNQWGGGLGGEHYVWIGTAWVIGSTPNDWVGASHGGQGGTWYSVAPPPYDSVIAPYLLGSGGGGNTGNHGGGLIDVRVTGTLNVLGSIRADGGVGNGNGAAGSGGSLRLRVGTLAGSATAYITANGGAAGGVRAGGGRVALEYSNRADYVGRVQASGSFGTSAGAGTIYELNTSTGLDKVTIEQLANATGTIATTTWPTGLTTGEGPFDQIVVNGGTLLVDGDESSDTTVIDVANGTLTISGPTAVGQIQVTGGTANIASTLEGHVLASGGTVNVTAALPAGSSLAVQSGTITLSTATAGAAAMQVQGGTLNLAGALAGGSTVEVTSGVLNINTPQVFATAASFQQLGGTVRNNSQLTLASFDGSVLGGTFTNLGNLTLSNDELAILAGVTLSQSGVINGDDTIGELTVEGTLTHEVRDLNGLSLKVLGNATVATTGVIQLTGKGLRGGRRDGNAAQAEAYRWNGTTYVIYNNALSEGGTHGGVGQTSTVVAYGSSLAPRLLGGGGGGGTSASQIGGNGGGALDLQVLGTFDVQGAINADGQTGAVTGGGGGAGGSVYLRVFNITGSGTVTANGAGFDRDGGGGRIALEHHLGTVPPLVAIGGALATAGSVYVRHVVTTPATVTRGLSSADDTLCELAATGAIACEGGDAFGMVSGAPLGIYTALASGPNAACALHDGGAAECWGDVGVTTLLNEPVDALSSLDVGVAAACGIRTSDGNLRCWGADTTIAAGVAGVFSSVALADTAACARNASGVATCFGSNTAQLISTAPVAALSALAGGSSFFCGTLSTGGAVVCWGTGAAGFALPGGSFGGVAAGRTHACAISTADQTVACWGDATDGKTAAPAGVAFARITAGDAYTCGHRVSDGALQCWGDTAGSGITP